MNRPYYQDPRAPSVSKVNAGHRTSYASLSAEPGPLPSESVLMRTGKARMPLRRTMSYAVPLDQLQQEANDEPAWQGSHREGRSPRAPSPIPQTYVPQLRLMPPLFLETPHSTDKEHNIFLQQSAKLYFEGVYRNIRLREALQFEMEIKKERRGVKRAAAYQGKRLGQITRHIEEEGTDVVAKLDHRRVESGTKKSTVSARGIRKASTEVRTEKRMVNNELQTRGQGDNENRLVQQFELYDAKWRELMDDRYDHSISFIEAPWPVLDCTVQCIEDITKERVQDFVFHPLRRKKSIHSHSLQLLMEMMKWHPDNFDGTMIAKFRKYEHPMLLEGARRVFNILTDLTRAGLSRK